MDFTVGDSAQPRGEYTKTCWLTVPKLPVGIDSLFDEESFSTTNAPASAVVLEEQTYDEPALFLRLVMSWYFLRLLAATVFKAA